MTHRIPQVEGDILSPAPDDTGIVVGSRAWYAWLAQDANRSFAFAGASGTFTARRERRRRGSAYWIAYRRSAGNLYKGYLGKADDLTRERLNTVAAALNERISTSGDRSIRQAARSRSARSHTVDVGGAGAGPAPTLLPGVRSSSIRSPDHLLTTKLSAPPIRPDAVPRPRLYTRLADARQRTLTLISAPAGFGKTTLLTSFLQDVAGPVAWLSLDARDNDPVRFWRYVIGALQQVHAHLGATSLLLLQSAQPAPVETVVTTLLNDLATLPGNMTLILDDYQVIDAQPIHDGLLFMLDHAPPVLHLILATRTDPPLPLARWRASGHLAEFRARDLRFTTEEAGTFLSLGMGLRLSIDDIAALAARTEGWIAGLHLVALALQGRADVADFLAGFTGSHRYILDYLVDEVVQRQPEPVQRFLRETSILERLTAPLCNAVTGRTDGQAMLPRVERANLFLVPLDEERRWYRYHQLFAEALRNHLTQDQPDLIAVLHRRAATWLEGNGLVSEAVGHGLAGEDWEQVTCLVEQHAEALWLRGEVATLEPWIGALPEAVVRSRPRLCLIHAWMCFLTGRLVAVESRLRDAAAILHDEGSSGVGAAVAGGVDSQSRQTLLGVLATIRAALASLRDDAPHAVALAREALAYLPDHDTHWRSQSCISLGIALDSAGDVTAAIQAFADAAAISRRAGNTFQAIIALWSLAARLIMQGRLHEAEQTYREALRFAEDRGEARLPAMALAHMGYGDLLRERNDLEQAEQHLRTALELGTLGGNYGTLLSTHMNLARVLQARGTDDAARATLLPAEELARRPGILPLYTVWLEATRARLWLAQGDLQNAQCWGQAYGTTMDDDRIQLGTHVRAFALFTLARVYLTQGDTTQALAVLERLQRSGESESRTGVVIEALTLQALALAIRGLRTEALGALYRALQLAAPAGYVRLFVDEGAPMAALLRQAHVQGIASDYVDHLLSQFGLDLEDATTRSRLRARQPATDQQLAEPLSARELDVLRLLVAGASNREIGQRLVVSAGTVKTHLQSIYGKLDVHNRTEAAARARILGLV